MSSLQDGQSESSKALFSSSSIADEENAPLLSGPSTGRTRITKRHSTRALFSEDFDRSRGRYSQYHSSDESHFFNFLMEKVKETRLAHWVDKLAVESEPGLTNAQLMLNNHDLKPGKKKFPSRKTKTDNLQLNHSVDNGELGISWASGLQIRLMLVFLIHRAYLDIY
jgi:hypothetical protein